jgi:hypothetical protein
MKVFKKLNLYKTACPLFNVVEKANITNMPCYYEIPVTKIKMQTLPCSCYKLFVFGHQQASVRK